MGTTHHNGKLVSLSDDTKKDQKTVIIAKHLCGLATDISLRSLQTFSCNSEKNNDEKLTKQAHGVAIATCCHHACSWADYTGAEWMTSVGFTSQEFNMMKVWSSWAHTLTKKIRTAEDLVAVKQAEKIVSETKLSLIKNIEIEKLEETASKERANEDDEDEHNTENTFASTVPRPQGITLQEMSVVGCMVKRIFDQGRVVYLQNLGMRAHQRRYCDRTLSPECYMILAEAS